jgi:hypothetical protein
MATKKHFERLQDPREKVNVSVCVNSASILSLFSSFNAFKVHGNGIRVFDHLGVENNCIRQGYPHFLL